MKKIIYVTTFCFCAFNGNAQNMASTTPANTKTMTAAEANALNGTAQPTINGIPYSQYKAQQDAKQAQQNQQRTAARNAVVPVNSTELNVTPVKTEAAPAQKTVAVKGSNQ
ncbi:MAG TPA: hypothetical protein VHL77_06725 [Ferruginibacter sp.]|jgi:hypothetical protein|nr:hypothetical protein [Ferruginibacter sp.]